MTQATATNVKVGEWQPMHTAPRNGDEVILAVSSRTGIRGRCLVGYYMPGGFCIEDHPAIEEGWYLWNGLYFDQALEPIAWMPLPEVPKFDRQSGQFMFDFGIVRPQEMVR